MPRVDRRFLRRLARKYIWWKAADEAATSPHRVMAQVMNLGEWEDVVELCRRVDRAALADVVTSAEPGEFNARSWAYWHYRLRLAEDGEVPPLPRRAFG